MLLETYQSKGLLTVVQVKGETSDKGIYAYRGDLVLKEGDLRDGSETDRKPPQSMVVQSAMILTEDKIKFINGLLPTLNLLSLFVEKYKQDLSDDCIAVFYVENIAEPMIVELEGTTYALLPYKDGMIWNEFLEELYIEKSDIKKLSAQDKVTYVYDEVKTYKPKGETLSFEAALEKTIEVIKEDAVGAI